MRNILKIFCLSFFLSLFGGIIFAQAGTGNILVIDDFESQHNTNLVGGLAGSWEKDPNNKNEYCRAEFVEDIVDSKRSAVLKLEFKVGPQGYNGYYTKLNGADLRAYKKLEFYLKSSSPPPSTIKLELKNHLDQVGNYLLTDIATSWKKISIPIEKFEGITDFSKITEFTIVFESWQPGNVLGEIYLDDIYFSSPEEEYWILIKKAQQDSERRKSQLQNIVQLPDEEFLELISKKSFEYFLNETSRITGFVKDRSTLYSPSSIAATGFGLAAICIGDSRGWLSHQDAYQRVTKVLESLKYKAEKEHGFFYHFVDMHTGKRVWNSEISSIDTALLLAGIIITREYFQQEYIKKLCDEIHFNVDWPWLMEPKTKLLYMGWNPENGFKEFILWDMFGEEMVMYILGLGSPSHPLPEKSWDVFNRPVKNYKDRAYIYCDSESLFTYQYSHGFIDFRNKHDKYADYRQNSLNATKSNISFCEEHRDKYRTYREEYWGISASDGPSGYKNYGATVFTHDGTVAPYSICGSIPFIPKFAISTLRKLLSEYGDKVWDDRYGFVSAFNIDKEWFSTEHIGIDLGITLLMIENYRSGFVWKNFMKNSCVQKGLSSAGFKPGKKKLNVAYLIKKFRKKLEFVKEKMYNAKEVKSIDEISKIKESGFATFVLPDDVEYGSIGDANDLNAKFAFLWDKKYLYFVVEVIDDKILANEKVNEIYKSDGVELFLSPGSDNLIWGNKKNFQIGIAPDCIEKRPVSYAFFQDIEPTDIKVLSVNKGTTGYKIVSALKWSFLNFTPQKGKFIGMSVAVHDKDGYDKPDKKINWSFRNATAGIKLGRLVLK
ncbi:MAG: glucoamylase family protein [Elusimicrobiota bacterium]